MSNKQKHIQNYFQSHIDEISDENLPDGHELRFLSKLENRNEKKTVWNWKLISSIAASIIIAMSLFFFTKNDPTKPEDTTYPQEFVEAQSYFNTVIDKELEKIKSYKDENNQALIDDMLKELKQLNLEEEALLKQLSEQYNKRIIQALINNFQIKINLLETVSEQVEYINQIQNNYHENNL